MGFRRSFLACQAVAALVCLISASFVRADAYDPPASYYATAIGTGATLKSQLHNIIDGHTVLSYSATTSALAITDVDPNNSNNLLTVYDRTSINKQYSSNPLIWNREHTWPRSRGIQNSGPDDSDLFNLRPSLAEGNGARENWNFGGTYGVTPMGLIVQSGDDMWYPGNADAGMIARQEFYMAVRYDGSDASTTNLELASGNPTASTGTLGDLNRLLEWHFAAPPDTFERRRNQVIYDQFQHNRDPFIDRPEWVWSVFADQANDTSLALNGGVAGVGGATTLNVDLGRRLVGSPLPEGQSVTLSKAGVDGTYYSVTTEGAATSTVTGRYNAFTIGAAGTKSVTVGLAPGTSTATAGLRSGTVTIDNLDVTTGGGAGKGANDANDVATVSLTVLDHANPSFSGANDVNTLNFDFGTVALGAAAPTFAFDLFNLTATEGFTAGLDLVGIVGGGDIAALTTDLAPFGGATPLAAGASKSVLASLATSTAGSFSASYTLSFSDENLVGATTLGSLTLSLSGVIEASAAATGDFDADGDVDGQDFLAWQLGLGLENGATRGDGDANGDLAVDAADLEIWQAQFADASAANATPEPRALLMLPLAALMMAATIRQVALDS
jgi:endonuclease I